MKAYKLPQNDTHRCQNCDGFGKIQRIQTGAQRDIDEDEEVSSMDWERVKYRVLECRDCGHTWRSDR